MNASQKDYWGDRPYNHYFDYLEEQFVYLALMIKDYLTKQRSLTQEMFKSDQKLQIIMKIVSKYDLDWDQTPLDWEERISSRIELTRIIFSENPFDRLAKKMGLSDFQRFVVLVGLARGISSEWEALFHFLFPENGTVCGTMPDIAKIYFASEEVTFIDSAVLLNDALPTLKLLYPELDHEGHYSTIPIVCDQRLMDILIDKPNQFTLGVTWMDWEETLEPLYFREEELAQLTSFIQAQDYPMFLIFGEKGIGKKHLISHFAKANQSSIIFFSLDSYHDENGIDFGKVVLGISYAARECLIHTVPLAITGFELLKESEQYKLVQLLNNQYKKSVQLIFLLMTSDNYLSSMEGLYSLEMKKYTELERIELWHYYAKDYQLDPSIKFESIGNTFVITPGQMIGALKQSALLSGGNHSLIQEKQLYKACYRQLDHELAKKTNIVKTTFKWEDLKIPTGDKEILQDMCHCVKNKHIVMREWQFSKIVPYGAGITVLFSGAPGTGKTMAAQVIANELNMELYKIDLSQVIDKYIGETEKNIKLIFTQAEKSNSILFFDEADALFNQRIEASTANDRYANIESSLLLQCIEEYSGISILATNNYKAIDSAFIRRFKYYVLFREPDEKVRYEIWSAVFPPEAPVSEDVDLRILAQQFQFTGAVIKNVALSAAYLAADKGEAIGILHILKSIKREMFKNNLILTKEKLGSLGYLFDEIK